jgi:hypothetical protein
LREGIEPMTIYYAAVEDDPLTSGKGSRVFASAKAGTIKGEDGRYRRMAFIGDPAWCVACKSMGIIIRGAPVPDQRRMLDMVNGGRRQAVGGDEVACNCGVRPKIIPVYGHRFRITGVIANSGPVVKRDVTATASQAKNEGSHTRWCLVRDGTTGEPLADRAFITDVGGVRRLGKTDSNGYAKIETNGEKSFDIHVIFSSPKRRLEPWQGT